jgi:hypothetical protein
MKNMDKGLTVPKWMLIVWPKIPQMPQNLSAQFVCPSLKLMDFNEKRLHWASVVRAQRDIVKVGASIKLKAWHHYLILSSFARNV